MSLTLENLPNEVLFQIFLSLPPPSIPALQQVSERFYNISQPLLWRYYCRTLFKFWSTEHRIQEKFNGNVNNTDWKALFVQRYQTNKQVSQKLDSIVASQSGRIPKVSAILENGDDAKDILLKNANVDDDAEDVLARRYYSDAVLGALHRSRAIQEWMSLRAGGDVPLERALGCFDLFLLHEREGDLDFISQQLDDIADQFCRETPKYEELTPRQKCIALAEYLRSRDLVGIKGNVAESYHDLEHNFIGVALQDPDHPSLPLISVSIYCGVAKRLGLNASPCGFPFHVMAIIKPVGQTTMDGQEINDGVPNQPMYMDPFRSGAETDIGSLRSQLVSFGVSADKHEKFLDATSTIEIVNRCARNILGSIQSMPSHQSHPISLDRYTDTDSSLYASVWAMLLFSESNDDAPPRAVFVPRILQRFEKVFYLDLPAIGKYLLPMFANVPQHVQIVGAIADIQRGDEPKRPKRRTPVITDMVPYKVGQYFRHRRYTYYAVITGWDEKCRASEEWISHMNVNNLERKAHQSFYHAQ